MKQIREQNGKSLMIIFDTLYFINLFLEKRLRDQSGIVCNLPAPRSNLTVTNETTSHQSLTNKLLQSR